MAVALAPNTPQAPRHRGPPAYARADLSPGIVHFGIGNFHRAHLQVYLDRLMNAGRDHDWAIVGAGVTPYDVKMRDALAGQDWLSTVVEQSAETLGGARHRRDDRLPAADGRRGDPAAAGGAGDPHRLADRHRGRLFHQPGDRRLRPGEPGDRRRRRATRGAEDGLRPDPRRPARPPRRRARAVHRASPATTSRTTASSRGTRSPGSPRRRTRPSPPGSATRSPSPTAWSTASPRPPATASERSPATSSASRTPGRCSARTSSSGWSRTTSPPGRPAFEEVGVAVRRRRHARSST